MSFGELASPGQRGFSKRGKNDAHTRYFYLGSMRPPPSGDFNVTFALIESRMTSGARATTNRVASGRCRRGPGQAGLSSDRREIATGGVRYATSAGWKAVDAHGWVNLSTVRNRVARA